jgi:transcription elongation factor SPT4
MSEYDDEDVGPRHVSASEVVPSNMRTLRACITCGLIKSTEQFYATGCENCPHLRIHEEKKRVDDFTSTSFEGYTFITKKLTSRMVALTNPEKSWVANWQGITKKSKGVYAIAVYGDIPEY